LISWAGLAVVAASCGGAEAKPRTTGVVDSVVPRDTAIARFQRTVRRVDSFEGGTRSRDELVRQFVAALEKRDTATLRSLLVSKSEFGWLYYPINTEGLPPYNLTPQLMWFMLEGNSEKGYRKLLERRSGKALHALGHRCEGDPSYQVQNTVWGPCVVLRRAESGDTLAERLFGQIVGRGGRYKFLSYANKL
jgi:hypothetical protein